MGMVMEKYVERTATNLLYISTESGYFYLLRTPYGQKT